MLSKKDMHNYQLQSADHILHNPKCGLFLDMGLGKTVSTLTAINRLIFEELDVDTVLVIAPKRVAESVWAQEIAKWAHLQDLEVSIIGGKVRQRKEALKKKAHIHTIGRDNVQWLCAQFGGSKLPFDMCVIDESSSFKSSKSARFKALRLIHFKRTVLLTGTPAPNGLIDLWPQVYLLDKGERLGRTIGEYRREYFKPGHTVGNVVYKYKANKGSHKKIYDAIGDICMSMKAKDYLDLPKSIEDNVVLTMPTEIAERYRDFEREKVLELYDIDTYITPANAAVLSGKLLQFANGAIYDEERNTHIVHDLKIEALLEIMESANGSPVLLAYTFKSDAERIIKACKAYNPRKLETDKDIQDWNAGKIHLMIMHPASGGHGLNLQKGGNIIVWYGQTWSLELLQQFNARLDRQGQTKPVIIKKLIVKDTMDVKVISSQKGKAKGQDSLMDAVKAVIKKYV